MTTVRLLLEECAEWSHAVYATALLRHAHPDRQYTVEGTDLGWGVFQTGDLL